MYFIPRLLTNRYIRHGISTIENGNMSFKYGDRKSVIENRKKFFDNIRIPTERGVFLEVQHDTKIIEATHSLAGTGFYSQETAIKADALITKEKNLALVLLTADCIPAIIFDRANQILGVAHLSRHNSKLKFVQTLVSFMKRECGTNIQDLKVFFGPSIQKKSYILPDFPNGYDLIEENIQQLLLKGVRLENISFESIDTVTSSDFFSHYRVTRSKEDEARFATAVMLV
jgi:copper oxidase (laccase) domain-containing protein